MIPTQACLAALCALLGATPSLAQHVFPVNSSLDTPDANPGDGLAQDASGTTSLRAAVMEANALGGKSLIRLAPNTNYALSISGSGEDAAATGDLDVLADITLQGRAATLDGAGLDRLFDVLAAGRLHVIDLTMIGGAVNAESGGAIRSAGDLLVVRSRVQNCTALGTGASGGALFNNAGFLLVEECELTGNNAERAGGAIEANAGTTLVDDSSLTSNKTGPGPGNGGALHLTGLGFVDVRDCKIRLNTASREGGGLWNSSTGTLNVDSCDIAENSALGAAADDGGGGVFNDGGLLVLGWSRIAQNTAPVGSGSGGGVFNREGTAFLLENEIANNSATRAGGGIEALVGFTQLYDNQVSLNTTGASPGNGGGLHLTGAGQVRASTTSFTQNTAAAEGGGMWNSATGVFSIDWCSFEGNRASGNLADQGGGGLFTDGGATTVRNSTFANNLADGTAGSGGGILNNLGNLSVQSCRLMSNQAKRAGGAIEANLGTTDIVRVAMSGNSTGPTPGNGGGVHLTGAGLVTVSFSRVVSNSATNEGGGLWNSSTGTMTVTSTTINSNTAPFGPNVFNNGGTFTIDGAPVPVGP